MVGVAVYLGCIAMIASNTMAVILDYFPHMAGTTSLLAGTLRASIGAMLAMVPGHSAWPMVSSMALCSIVAMLLYLYCYPAAQLRRLIPILRRMIIIAYNFN